jgi:hypothetical protein
MQLHGDGRVQIWPDRPGAELTAFGVASSRPASAALDGQFVAVGDLLFIAWRDGTRLNLRWYRNEDDLVLADHEGRVSRLKRLLE